MQISVFGLGYVGAVSAACLANDGHEVIGVDPNLDKIEQINSGQASIIEEGLNELISTAVSQGRLKALSDAAAAVHGTQLSLVCVGTPSQYNGGLDTRFVRRVCEEIGGALRHKDSHHTVVIRSTILPGTMRDLVIPTLETASGKTAGIDFAACNNPEFLREGTAIYDYYHPPKTVIGEVAGDGGGELEKIYAELDAPLIRTDVATAEMVKYVDNSWHALKVAFSNEIGNVCGALAIDSHAVMDIFCQDKKLNLSAAYLKPGFAFGGSCLPKDVRALSYRAKSLDLDLPVLNAILPSNSNQVQRALDLIVQAGHRSVGVLGMTFKAGTDDLRESPVVELIERLIGKGYDVRVYDKFVQRAQLIGANKDFILNRIPHIFRLMVDSGEEILEHAGTVVVGTNSEEFVSLVSKATQEQHVIELIRLQDSWEGEAKYDGICW
jgi:GDP-mannose 6-dehydrogenase